MAAQSPLDPGTTDTLVLDSLTLESGGVLRGAPVTFTTWGSLNPTGDNAVLICHALTGNSVVTDWWPGVVGPGLAIDTDRYFVVCANVLGSPYGSASPVTVNAATGEPYGRYFPAVTIRDTVAAHRCVLDHLGVRSVVAAIGASLGGMQVLEWAFHDDLVQSIVPIAVGGRHSAWCIGWSEAQRQAIYGDPDWRGGLYAPDRPPAQGLATARMIAMISYRSHGSFEERFGRTVMQADTDDPLFSAESYLRYQGQKLVDRFDANCYVHLTRQMDSHDLSRGRGTYPAVLAKIRQPALVIGIKSDVLYPLEEQETLARHLPHATLCVLDSPFGHDSFLIERERMSGLLFDWLEARRFAVRPPSNNTGGARRAPGTMVKMPLPHASRRRNPE